jgi:segregation and condensation protein B
MSNKAIIESLLYVSGADGIDISDIKRVLDIPSDEIRDILKQMSQDYETDTDSGLIIKVYDNHYYLFTKPEHKDLIAKLADVRLKNPLTPALLETLAIIAYNTPCTRIKIDEIRGTNSEGAIARLTNLKLINEAGRAETPGRPYIYELTQEFFNLFGIKSLKELPKIDFSISEDFDVDTVDFFNTNHESK